MNLMKSLVTIILLFLPAAAVTSTNWWWIWLCLEIMTFTMVGSMYFSNKLAMSEVSMIYFLVQSLSGILLLVGGSYVNQLWLNESYWSILFLVGLATKLGLFPVHFWVVPMMSLLSFWQMGLLLGPMKIIPLSLLSNFNCQSMWYAMLLLALMSMMFGASLGLILPQLKSMLGASSIVHSGWFVLAALSNKMWFYFWAYYISLLVLLVSLHLEKGNLSAWSLISLSGLPPFLLFVAKANVLLFMSVEVGHLWLLILPLSSTLISLFFYLKYTYALWLKGDRAAGSFSMIWYLLAGAAHGTLLIMC